MTEMIENALQLLQSSCAPEAMAVMDPDPAELMEANTILEHCQVPASRGARLLALFALLLLARKRHEHTSFSDESLTRNILDGDYFQSLYLQLAVQFGEMDLVRYLAPRLKKYYIVKAAGKSSEEPLMFCLVAYLQAEQAAARKERVI